MGSKKLLTVIFFASLLCCKTKNENRTKNDNEIVHVISGDTVTFPKGDLNLNGEQLALIYCQKCHSFPKPDLIPKASWERGVLPRMAQLLGINSQDNSPLNGLTFREMEVIYKEGVFPEKPLISSNNWNKIVDYYLSNAPDSAKVEQRPEVKKGLQSFIQIIPSFNLNTSVNVTVIEFDSVNSNLLVGDSDSKINVLNTKGEIQDTLKVNSPSVDIICADNNYTILNIGFLTPSDLPEGSVQNLIYEKGVGSVGRNLIVNLKRPVSLVEGDLNQDGNQDLVVSNFGYNTGYLAWYENNGRDQYVEHVLRREPGAQKTILKDMNGDNLPDIVALMSQGDEGIFCYYNQGNGKFREETILKFSPIAGSNYFDLIDFNEDGHLDILYVNGDNADFSFSLKKYHGLSIYLNDGNNHFTQKWFYPLYGASKAIASDFDKDGDIDLAAIAFFADFQGDQPLPFVYLENQGDYNFKSSTLTDPTIGRWLTMESGDFDKDGDMDIALGKYLTSPTPLPKYLSDKWKKSSPYILILNNQLIKNKN